MGSRGSITRAANSPAKRIEVSVRQYCEAVRARLERCSDFDSKRQFVLDNIEKIVCTNDRVAIYGSMPVKLRGREASDHPGETTNMGFCIDGFVDRRRLAGVSDTQAIAAHESPRTTMLYDRVDPG